MWAQAVKHGVPNARHADAENLLLPGCIQLAPSFPREKVLE